eukprot:GHVL01013507.1.p1 GENE.GHVL01013507.1~~GHVL01013507.1.p1  ORF type:complete len:237 (+),score=22.32 GHVL01013507.1:117-827(+)
METASSPNPAVQGGRSPASRFLFIGNLPKNTTDETLIDVLKPYGRVEQCKVKFAGAQDSCFAFVTMVTQEEAEVAMANLHHSILQGMEMRFEFQKQKQQFHGVGDDGWRKQLGSRPPTRGRPWETQYRYDDEEDDYDYDDVPRRRGGGGRDDVGNTVILLKSAFNILLCSMHKHCIYKSLSNSSTHIAIGKQYCTCIILTMGLNCNFYKWIGILSIMQLTNIIDASEYRYIYKYAL